MSPSKCIADDLDTDPGEPIPFTYNPMDGAAWYFTLHGCILRRLGHYDVCGPSNKNNDSLPGVDEECRKIFPQVNMD